MNAPFLRRLFLCCLTAGLVLAACEPITVVLPGGTVIVNPPPLEPGQGPGPEDAGVDGGTGDAGPGDAGSADGGTDDAGTGDAGADGGSQGWSLCTEGWQHRVAVPLGSRSGDPYFALAPGGDVYVTQYPDFRLGVRSLDSGLLPAPDLGWEDIPWVGGIEVDAWDTLHLGVSSFDGGTLDSQSIEYLTYADGDWKKTRVGQGQILDFALASDGSAHVMSLGGEPNLRYFYATNRSGTFVSEPTGLSAEDMAVRGRLRVDARGVPHFVYDGRRSSAHGVYYATQEGGRWVSAQLAQDGVDPTLALDRDGVPHVLWTWTDGLWHGVRNNGTWNISHVASDVSGMADFQLDSTGHLHVLAMDGQQDSVLYLSNDYGFWRKVTLATAVMVRNENIGPVLRLRLDAAERVHAMYSLLQLNEETFKTLRVVEYSRECGYY